MNPFLIATEFAVERKMGIDSGHGHTTLRIVKMMHNIL